MPQKPKNNFLKRKEDILSKIDKSSKGDWDEKILKLCEKINFLENYYTTSSCSGRVILMISQEKKSPNLFVKVYHGLVSFNQLKKDIDRIIKNKKYKNKSIKFKLEPCILHVACRSLEDAKKIYDKAKLAGWKRSGLIGFGVKGKRVILELNSTEKFEFPIIEKGMILVDDVFLKRIIEESNKKLKRSWEKIERLKDLV